MPNIKFFFLFFFCAVLCISLRIYVVLSLWCGVGGPVVSWWLYASHLASVCVCAQDAMNGIPNAHLNALLHGTELRFDPRFFKRF